MLLKQSTRDWVAYKQQKCISHSSGSGEVQGQRAGRGHILVVPLLVSLQGRKQRRRMLCCEFYKGTNPTHEDSILMISSNSCYLPKAPSPNTITLVVGEDTNISL